MLPSHRNGCPMLEAVDLTYKLARDDYRIEKDQLVARLSLLQQQAHRNNVPIIVVFEGWEAAGKGSRIGDLTANLDPRTFNVYSTEKPVGHEKRKPFMERFWTKIGAHGSMTIFDRSWYSRIAALLAEKSKKKRLKLKQDEFGLPLDRLPIPYGGEEMSEVEAMIASIATFEKQFADDGYIIVKFFLHISKEEQKKRLDRLAANEETRWRATKQDYRENENYERYYAVFDRTLEKTNYPYAPWHVISGMDNRAANLEIMYTLADAIERGLGRKSVRNSLEKAAIVAESKLATADDLISTFPLVKVPGLDDVTYDNTITNEAYRDQLKAEQKRLRLYHDMLHERHIPLLIAYEGWDAAGKGSNIKRITKGLDARGYRVMASAAPSWEEQHHPFLWRYWATLPRNGHVAIYDRSWYGRVLVERVEGLASAPEWRRAYDEINEFEWELQQWGAILIKFWVNVSQDEQLRRFEDRQNNPLKSWKLTEEDWRNREKYPQYKTAVEDMLRLTSTEYAPWQIIESDSKYFARVKALRAVNEAIEKRLEL